MNSKVCLSDNNPASLRLTPNGKSDIKAMGALFFWKWDMQRIVFYHNHNEDQDVYTNHGFYLNSRKYIGVYLITTVDVKAGQ